MCLFHGLEHWNFAGELGFEAMGKLYKKAESMSQKRNTDTDDSGLDRLSSGHVWRAVNLLVKQFDRSESSSLNFQVSSACLHVMLDSFTALCWSLLQPHA